jgi:hypothetical protein
MGEKRKDEVAERKGRRAGAGDRAGRTSAEVEQEVEVLLNTAFRWVIRVCAAIPVRLGSLIRLVQCIDGR